MKRAALIYNPSSGTGRERRVRDVEAAAAVLRSAGVDVELTPTTAAGSAPGQAQTAIAGGCDTVIAAGGDGTLNEVLQAVMGTNAVLAVLPMGTGNAMAADLRIPRDPRKGAQALLDSVPTRVPCGRARFAVGPGQTGERYFTVMGGAGADAELVYNVSVQHKGMLGMTAYYGHAARLFVVNPWRPFDVQIVAADGSTHDGTACQLLASRLGRFPGMLRHITPRASLFRNDFELVILKKPARLPLVIFMTNLVSKKRWRIRHMESVLATKVVCKPLEGSKDTRVQLDGEVCGRLPAEFEIVPDAFTALIPKARLALEKK